MPRRNRNARTPRPDADLLAAQNAHLAAAPAAHSVPCAACGVNPATTGDYCALCKGQITISARRTTLTRR